MRSLILAVPEADQARAQQMAIATWPATAQGMFEQAYLRDGERWYLNTIGEVSDIVDEQLREMKERYIPNAEMIPFDTAARAGAAYFAIYTAGFTKEATE